MLNSKLEHAVATLKEAYFKTPLEKRFTPGCFTQQFIKDNKNKLDSLNAWFSWENPIVAKMWAFDNLPNWEGEYNQLKALEHFFENFVLLYGKDDKYVTDDLLYRGYLNFNENPYFIDLLEHFGVTRFVASTEIKSSSLMTLMKHGYTIKLIEAKLADNWKHRAKECTHLFLIEKLP